MTKATDTNVKSKYPSSVNDEGHWFGFRFGIQTKPSGLRREWKYTEWWTFIIMYEYRFDRTVSFLVEYHHFNKKADTDIEYSAVDVALKSRIHILKKLRIAAEGGLAISSVFPALLLLYGGSFEYEINKNITPYFNIRTFSHPDFGYWLTIGINYNLSNIYK